MFCFYLSIAGHRGTPVAGDPSSSCDLPRYLFRAFPQSLMGSVSRGLTAVLTNGMPVVNLPDSCGRRQDGDLLCVAPVPLAIVAVLAICT